MEVVDCFTGLLVRHFEHRKGAKTHHLEAWEYQKPDALRAVHSVACRHFSRLQHPDTRVQDWHGRKGGIYVLAPAQS